MRFRADSRSPTDVHYSAGYLTLRCHQLPALWPAKHSPMLLNSVTALSSAKNWIPRFWAKPEGIWKSKPGRPPIPAELRRLIREMSRDNSLWGEERIANELLIKLGIRVSPRTVRKYMRRKPGLGPRRDQRWRTFLRNHSSCHRRLRFGGHGELSRSIEMHRSNICRISPPASEHVRLASFTARRV
jgi:hypothetical protein